ncbi:99_t:CDS:2 [Entrophospora sp. SA101]|nr:99_t:CDS:2 [Entrophospora sp. SA101]
MNSQSAQRYSSVSNEVHLLTINAYKNELEDSPDLTLEQLRTKLIVYF